MLRSIFDQTGSYPLARFVLNKIKEVVGYVKDADDSIKALIGLKGTVLLLLEALPFSLKLTSLKFPVEVDLVIFIPSVLLALTLLLFFFVAIIPKLRSRLRTRNSSEYWKRLNQTIRTFHDANATQKQKDNANEEYQQLREYLLELCVVHQGKIIKHYDEHHPGATRYGTICLDNFRTSFYSSELNTWKQKCKRNLADDLDCFDTIPFIMQNG